MMILIKKCGMKFIQFFFQQSSLLFPIKQNLETIILNIIFIDFIQMADLQKEVEMLKQYSKTLESQNDSRNRERQVMEEEIKRLSKQIFVLNKEIQQDKTSISLLKQDKVRLQSQIKQGKNQQTLIFNIKKSAEYQLLQQKYTKIQSQHQKYKNNQQKLEKYRKLQEEKNTLALQKSNMQYKISHYELKIKNLQKQNCQIATVANKQSISEVDTLKNEIIGIKREAQQKDVIIRSMEKENQEKDIEARRLNSIISTYMDKINRLEQKIQKLSNSQLHPYAQSNSFKTEDIEIYNISLKDRYDNLVNENYTLNEKIRGMQRRIQVLQTTNKSLEDEFRLSIESRKASSKLSISHWEDDNLKLVLKQIQDQLDEQKQQNHQIRQQNQYLQAKISEYQISIKKNSGQQKQWSYLRNKNKRTEIMEQNRNGLYSFKQMGDMLNSVSPKSKPYRYLEKEKCQNPLEKQKDDLLQKKINILKQQNAGLKKHLFIHT